MSSVRIKEKYMVVPRTTRLKFLVVHPSFWLSPFVGFFTNVRGFRHPARVAPLLLAIVRSLQSTGAYQVENIYKDELYPLYFGTKVLFIHRKLTRSRSGLDTPSCCNKFGSVAGFCCTILLSMLN